MAARTTKSGFAYDSLALDRVERRFWRECWAAVPAAVASERGVALRGFGPVQVSVVDALPDVGMMNLVLGATNEGALDGGYLEAACNWVRSRGVASYVPVSPGMPSTAAVEGWLRESGFSPVYAWMKFVRDPHPPRFKAPDVEVVEVGSDSNEPFGAIAASGFGLPAWAGAFFARLPGRDGWRCYVARIEGTAQACAAMLLDGGVAEFGIAATLEPARGRGCQLALLHRRVADAAQAGCHTLFVETGARVEDRPANSYRNILRAGFEEAYLRPNWTKEVSAPSSSPAGDRFPARG